MSRLPQGDEDERAPLLPTVAAPDTPVVNPGEEAGRPGSPTNDDIMPPELLVKKKMTRADLVWRIIFATFIALLAVFLVKGIADSDSPDVSVLSKLS